MTRPFVHLHTHSEYSLLDGAARIGGMVQLAKEQGAPAVAITDHGSMYGAVPFFKEAKKSGVKPIIGCEIYVAQRTLRDRTPKVDDDPYHLVLLATNPEGYRNLVKIVSVASLEGFYYKPRADHDLLAKYSKGLIALSACLGGALPRHILSGHPGEALNTAALYRDIFGRENFFIELQNHHLEDQRRSNPELIRIARELGLGLVATNDSHYLRREDARAHDVLLCIQTATNLDDPNRMRFANQEFYMKSGDEMEALFRDVPEALDNTVAIAERCDFKFETGEVHLPHYEIPTGETPEDYLDRLCREGFIRRYGTDAPPGHHERLDRELSLIKKMGYSSYFLVVWDFIHFARGKHIPVGPGRGSAAGSMVAYTLGITDIDPIRYGLLFDRFLNPERIDMPDIDTDICERRRDEVIQYVVEKYGADKVSQIAAFSTIAARGAIRDVARALGLAYGEGDRIAKMVPFQLGITLDKALEQNPDLRAAYESSSQVKDLIDLARSVEGMPRHVSVHAAGVVISRSPIADVVPLQRGKDEGVVTQFGMKHLQELGLIKMDFLGLRTLTVLDEALKIIKRTRHLDVDLMTVPREDRKVFRMLSDGNTAGCFQLESGGMTDLVRRLHPDRFEDLVAILALFRPGPLGSGMVDDYVERRHGKKFEYIHPTLEPILKDTYGVMIYQEQVMRVANVMAGFTLGGADLLRRAISKKQPDVIAAQKVAFVDGAKKQGIDPAVAEKVFQLIEYFAGYGFNKSHTAPYALLAYQTAYLKAYYTVEFMAAVLTSEMGNAAKVATYVEECRRLGIRVLPPDVNESLVGFTVVGHEMSQEIRFGLAAVKNVGLGAIQAIIEERKAGGPFRSFQDFCERVDSKVLNKRVVESLTKAGAFDSLGARRSQMLAVLDQVLEAAAGARKQRSSGQLSFFDLGGAPGTTGADFQKVQVNLPDVPEYRQEAVLAMEKELLGLYISGHPLGQYEAAIRRYATHSISQLGDLEEGTKVVVCGMITGERRIATKKGEPMSFLAIEDLAASLEVVVFPRVFEKCRKWLAPDKVVIVRGRVNVVERRAATGAGAGAPGGGGGAGAPDADEDDSEPQALTEDQGDEEGGAGAAGAAGPAGRAERRATEVKIIAEDVSVITAEEAQAAARFGTASSSSSPGYGSGGANSGNGGSGANGTDGGRGANGGKTRPSAEAEVPAAVGVSNPVGVPKAAASSNATAPAVDGERRLYVNLANIEGKSFLLDVLKQTLAEHNGPTPVYLCFSDKRMIRTNERYWVDLSDKLLGEIEEVAGPGSAKVRQVELGGGRLNLVGAAPSAAPNAPPGSGPAALAATGPRPPTPGRRP